MLRECDNDSCDYETYVDDGGRPRARWQHVADCPGPPKFDLYDDVPPSGSFLEYLLGRKG